MAAKRRLGEVVGLAGLADVGRGCRSCMPTRQTLAQLRSWRQKCLPLESLGDQRLVVVLTHPARGPRGGVVLLLRHCINLIFGCPLDSKKSFSIFCVAQSKFKVIHHQRGGIAVNQPPGNSIRWGAEKVRRDRASPRATQRNYHASAD